MARGAEASQESVVSQKAKECSKKEGMVSGVNTP